MQPQPPCRHYCKDAGRASSNPDTSDRIRRTVGICTVTCRLAGGRRVLGLLPIYIEHPSFYMGLIVPLQGNIYNRQCKKSVPEHFLINIAVHHGGMRTFFQGDAQGRITVIGTWLPVWQTLPGATKHIEIGYTGNAWHSSAVWRASMKASEEWKESLREMPAAFFLNHTDAVESIDAIDGTDTRSHWRIRLCEILLVFPQ